LILLLVLVALLSRQQVWGHASMARGSPHEVVSAAGAAYAAQAGSPCHADEPASAEAAPHDQGCRIACDLGTMPPLAAFAPLQACGYVPVRLALVPTQSSAPPRAPDRPPPR
jgi:hypothetical protein